MAFIRRQSDVILHHSLRGTVLTIEQTNLQRRDDAGFRNRDGLLLHGLVDRRSILIKTIKKSVVHRYGICIRE
jgi:hypothetical protein